MESDREIDYMSEDFIEKANEFDKENKIQKDILKHKKILKKESSESEHEENVKHYFKSIFLFKNLG